MQLSRQQRRDHSDHDKDDDNCHGSNHHDVNHIDHRWVYLGNCLCFTPPVVVLIAAAADASTRKCNVKHFDKTWHLILHSLYSIHWGTFTEDRYLLAIFGLSSNTNQCASCAPPDPSRYWHCVYPWSEVYHKLNCNRLTIEGNYLEQSQNQSCYLESVRECSGCDSLWLVLFMMWYLVGMQQMCVVVDEDGFMVVDPIGICTQSK